MCHPGAARAAGARDDTLAPPPSTVYASVSNVGAFKDAGPTDSWTGLTALPSASGALALATGDSAHWRDVFAGSESGVYASHDGGANWTAGLPGHTVRAALVGFGSARVLAGAERLYRSDDGGKTWAYGGIARPVSALAQGGGGAQSVYAAGTGRAWASRDGRRWTSIRRGLPDDLAINDLAVNGPTLYAATGQGVWQCANRVWTPLHGLPAKAATGVVVSNGRIVTLIADDGLYASTDGGQTWSALSIRGLAAPVTALAQDPQRPAMLAIGDKAGAVHWSTDGGQTWGALGSTVAGNDGNPIRALATVQRVQLPVDAVQSPQKDGTRYANGHTVSGPFLAYYQDHQDALGLPETEPFRDPKRGGAYVQYFQNMALQQGDRGVSPLPLGLAQPGVIGLRAAYPLDAHFKAYYDAHGGQDVFGPAVSPLLNRPTNDGTGQSLMVQYVRNARLEYRPVSGAVAVGKLGDQALQAIGWL